MTKAPPIPPEQRAFKGQKPDIEGQDRERRDDVSGVQSDQPGDADINLKEQGRHGNIRQNTTHQGNQQNR
ncbi:MAG: hypothetical protein Q8M88_12825 [Phenylobacterium sp.]|uniref:hypothetical protein n=1 Tax=Phenylobacterium sp. TaxID=1871053 RepID=UPI00273342EB|nr:hypothetical protein [Phenylobacterium sp.]MDP3175308.1 hypothetical protein [Phenylobacterium sp.]